MKVLIIDDQALFADGIRHLLKKYDPSFQTSYANNIQKASEHIESNHPPDIILLDINHSDSRVSYDLLNRLNAINFVIPVIVISLNTSSEAAALAIENNASGFISKNCDRQIVLDAILSVLDGKMFLSKPEHKVLNKPDELSVERVTSRQQEVLYLLSQGLLNKQIASELDISANTVKAHLHDLFRSLDVTNRTAAVKNGQKYGLI